VLQKGERVFYADNSKDYLIRCGVFGQVVRDMGLEPVLYGGVGNMVRQSSVDSEIRNDFYTARAIVLYFGSPKQGSDHEDNWVLEEIRHVAESVVPCLLYVSKDFPREILVERGYHREPEVVSSEAEFSIALQRDLAKLIAS
jgi:hypothetical protein